MSLLRVAPEWPYKATEAERQAYFRALIAEIERVRDRNVIPRDAFFRVLNMGQE